MQHIFLPPDQFDGSSAVITGQDHQHLTRVMRAQPGTRVLLLDGLGCAYVAEVTSIEKSQTTAAIIEDGRNLAAPEPGIRISVFQALARGDKFEQVLQHGTEAGATEFHPVLTERCSVDLPREAARVKDRVARWNAIVKGAAEQSGRLLTPRVYEPVKFAHAAREVTESDTLKLLLHPNPASRSLKMTLENRQMGSGSSPFERIALGIGPEGGWSPAEERLAQDCGWEPIALGARILRTETAALVAISQLIYCLDN